MVLQAAGQQMKCLEISTAMQTSRSWAEWAPGLVAAIVEALRLRYNLEKQDVNEELAQHRRYRRDCRRCLEMMGSDGHHRRTPGDRGRYCLSLDIAGPMPVGDDVGLAPGEMESRPRRNT